MIYKNQRVASRWFLYIMTYDARKLKYKILLFTYRKYKFTFSTINNINTSQLSSFSHV